MARVSCRKIARLVILSLFILAKSVFGLEGTYVSHLADESNRSCLLDLMRTVQVSSTSADTGVHKVLPSRGKPGLPRATGPRMLCRSAEACDSYECVRIVAIVHMASKLLLLPTD